MATVAERTATAGRVAACWSCRGPLANAGTAFCETCGTIQPPAPVDHFVRLGLQPGFAVDRTALDHAYFDWARRLHPDRFASASARERQFSQSHAVSLNEAYEVLKDPLRLAGYLLTLAGRAGPEHERTVQDPVLLMEAMEQREALEDAADLAAVDALAAGQRHERASCLTALAAAFGAGDLATAERLTLRLKYLAKYGDEIRLRRMRLAMSA